MTDPGTTTRTVDVKGRSIVVRQLKDAQLIIMGRDLLRMEEATTSPREKLEIAGYIMDMFESAIVEDADRKYVLHLTRLGEVELADYLGFLQAFRDEPNRATKRAAAVRGRRPARKSTV